MSIKQYRANAKRSRERRHAMRGSAASPPQRFARNCWLLPSAMRSHNADATPSRARAGNPRGRRLCDQGAIRMTRPRFLPIAPTDRTDRAHADTSLHTQRCYRPR